MSSEFNDTSVAKPLEFLADRYDSIESIGSGAMGDVYKARDKNLKLDVAVKVLSKQTPTDEDMIRFHREAKAYGKCNHENLVKLLDFGATDASEPFLIMEFFDGDSVDDIIVSRQAPPKRTELDTWLDVFIQVCRGMEHAHRNGIVHRDIKTRNILVAGLAMADKPGSKPGKAGSRAKSDSPTKAGKPKTIDKQEKADKPTVKIIDFGLAKIEDYAGDATLTKVGAVVGSPLYLSPEQAGGNKADARSDIYSFGCVMYFALTGQLPFRGETPLATIRGHLKEAPSPLREINPEVDDALEEIVLRCLEKSPESRYQTMGELEGALSKRLERGAPNVVPERLAAPSSSDSTDSSGSQASQSPAQRKISRQKIAMAMVVVACMFAAVFWLDQAIKGQLQERQTASQDLTNQPGRPSRTATKSKPFVPDLPTGVDSVEQTAIWTDTEDSFRIKVAGKRLSLQPKNLKNVTDSDLKKINWEKVDKNKYIELDLTEATKVTGSGFQYLPASRIYSLRLNRSGIVDSSFEHIAKMPNLENLTFTYTLVSVEGLRKITGLKNLRSLHLGYCPRIDDRAAMLIVKTWPNLTHLSLAEARITRDSIKELTKLKHLVELSLTDTPANDEDVIALSKINMTEFYLNHCPITDKALTALENMSNLRELGIYGCKGLTEQGCEALRNKRQNVKFPGEPPREYVEFYFSDEIH